MRLAIVAVGRQRRGPEGDLVADYLDRAVRTGRGVGLTAADLTEVEGRRPGGVAAEAEAIRRALPQGPFVALDERGRALSSPDFANRIADWRDAGLAQLSFAIGGADGLDPALRQEAALVLSFGPMVWPHLLARVMLAEQLYRATSILAGTPYHRA
jgi:23S rRNA (pseudouridine1915-N3)-methyltransferase